MTADRENNSTAAIIDDKEDTTTRATAASTEGTMAKEAEKDRQYRMVALDLDGTLLNSDHELAASTAEYLRYLDQQGFTVSIATGRAISTVYATIKALNIPKPIPVVCSNGAEGYMCLVVNDGPTKFVVKEALFATPLPDAVARRTLELSKQMGFVAQYYVGEQVYADPRKKHHYKMTDLYRVLTGSKTIYCRDDFEEALSKGLPAKELILCRDVKEQDKMLDAFTKELSKEPYLINGKPTNLVRGNTGWFMEVLHPDVCKGNGLVKMCQCLDIPIEECLAFGDGDNDVEFLQLAGRGFAMKNARPVTKEIADEEIPYTNDEEGVMKTLQSLEREGCLVLAASSSC